MDPFYVLEDGDTSPFMRLVSDRTQVYGRRTTYHSPEPVQSQDKTRRKMKGHFYFELGQHTLRTDIHSVRDILVYHW